MDRRERQESLQEALLVVLAGFQSSMWTALPAIIQSFDPLRQTCSAQPAIQARLRDTEGTFSWVNLPLLTDVPVFFPSGGGYSLTFPVAAGDECLVVFSSRCIDAWWQSGVVGVQADQRLHDLSDGIAFVGIKSQPHKLNEISTDSVQLRNTLGTTFIEIQGGTITLKAPTLVVIDSPATECTGNLQVDGVINAQGGIASGGVFTDNGVNVGSTHTHSGVDPGGGNSGPPNP